MPSFYPECEDLDIDPDEYLDSCSVSEKKELVELLIEDGYISKEYKIDDDKSVCPDDFDEALKKLYGKSYMLTTEEEQLILKIAKRF